MRKILDWFELHDPLDTSHSSIRCLGTGLTAADEDCIKCDDAENVGRAVQMKLDNVYIENTKIKIPDYILTIEVLRPEVRGNKKLVHIDPSILFTRLTATAGPDDHK